MNTNKPYEWSQSHLENPVSIEYSRHYKKFVVMNEGGDLLFDADYKDTCIAWCKANKCYPIPTNWADYHSPEVARLTKVNTRLRQIVQDFPTLAGNHELQPLCQRLLEEVDKIV